MISNPKEGLLSHMDDNQVIEYLKNHPEFFEVHANLLSDIKVGHASGEAVSLIERQVELLRERILRMRRRMNLLLQTARNNDELFAKVRSLTLTLLDTHTWHDLNEALATNMLVDFNADYVCCHVQNHYAIYDHIRDYRDTAPFDPFVRGIMPVCATLRAAELQALFPMQTHETDGSAVLLPLSLKQGAGCLAVGSRDTRRFTRDLDTYFVGYMADVLSRVIDRLD